MLLPPIAHWGLYRIQLDYCDSEKSHYNCSTLWSTPKWIHRPQARKIWMWLLPHDRVVLHSLRILTCFPCIWPSGKRSAYGPTIFCTFSSRFDQFLLCKPWNKPKPQYSVNTTGSSWWDAEVKASSLKEYVATFRGLYLHDLEIILINTTSVWRTASKQQTTCWWLLDWSVIWVTLNSGIQLGYQKVTVKYLTETSNFQLISFWCGSISANCVFNCRKLTVYLFD